MKFYLLTHSRELNRATNTGQLAIDCFGTQVERIIWDRVNPNRTLLELIGNNEIALLHPDGLRSSNSIKKYDNYLIIDSTWQEANKIFNRSTYLKDADKISFNGDKKSTYLLRRNQPIGGLCTAECIIQLLITHGEIEKASRLQNKFSEFNHHLS